MTRGVENLLSLMVKYIEYADDAGLGEKDVDSGATRMPNQNVKADLEAGMSISIPKTKVQYIKRRPVVT